MQALISVPNSGFIAAMWLGTSVSHSVAKASATQPQLNSADSVPHNNKKIVRCCDDVLRYLMKRVYIYDCSAAILLLVAVVVRSVEIYISTCIGIIQISAL